MKTRGTSNNRIALRRGRQLEVIKQNCNEALQFVSRHTKTIAELFNVMMVFSV